MKINLHQYEYMPHSFLPPYLIFRYVLLQRLNSSIPTQLSPGTHLPDTDHNPLIFLPKPSFQELIPLRAQNIPHNTRSTQSPLPRNIRHLEHRIIDLWDINRREQS